MEKIGFNKETTYRYLTSAVITFLAGFALVVTPELQTLTVDGLTDGVILGLFLAGVRAGIKGIAEMYILGK